MRHGGRILVDQLALNGVELVFQVPGESFLAALDGLWRHPAIRTVTGRQEGGVAMMAEAVGKLTGRPGIAFVTRGPGATNASAGVHVARQDSTPMVLFVGQVPLAERDREAFQEVDYRRMFAPLAKWVAEIEDVRRIPEYVARAFHLAMAGRPGPVVLALPEDVLSGEAEVEDAPPVATVVPRATPEEVAVVGERLARSERPFLLVGGGRWEPAASDALARFAAAWELPVGTAFRCQDHLDNRHPCYAGDVGIGVDPQLAEAIRDSDLLLAIGTRLDEITTSGYRLLAPPAPVQRLIHVHPDADEAGRTFRPELAVVSSPAAFLERAAALPAPAERPWAERTRTLHARYLSWSGEPEPAPGGLDLARVVRHLDAILPEDAVVTNGAGNYAGWVHRYFRFKHHGTQLAPRSGSMGYALPAAVAAKLLRPEREVVCFAGDGCFQMTMQEFGTACQHGASILVLVVNNGIYGTIRMHQERRYPGRVSGTVMRNPDFAGLARAYGAYGARVTRDEDIADAIVEARRSDGPALLELMVDPEALTTRLRLDDLRRATAASG